MRNIIFPVILPLLCITLAGCGYTANSMLDPGLRTIYVQNFKEGIDITQEPSQSNKYKTYRPRLEIDVTQAIKDRYLFDGTLRLIDESAADLVLSGALTDFRREPTKYGENDTIEQYRLVIAVDLELKNTRTGAIVWQDKGFSGSYYYYITGPQAKTEDQAVAAALQDIARRIVDRTVEAW